MAKFDFELGDHRLVARYSVGSCSRVEGDKRIEAHRAPKLLCGCVGRSDRSCAAGSPKLTGRRERQQVAVPVEGEVGSCLHLGIAFLRVEVAASLLPRPGPEYPRPGPKVQHPVWPGLEFQRGWGRGPLPQKTRHLLDRVVKLLA